MTRFAQQFAASARSNLMLEFAEPVGYYNRAGDALRTIDAIVIRDPMQIASETGEVNTQALIVRVANDVAAGITSSEINTGGDEISVPLRVGGTAVRRAVARVLDDSNGFVRFLLQ